MSKDKRTPLEETFDLPPIDDIVNEQNSLDDVDSDYEDDDYQDDTIYDEIDNAPVMTEEELARSIQHYNQAIQEVRQVGLPVSVTKDMTEYSKNMTEIHTAAMEHFNDLMASIMSMEAGVGSKYLAGAVKLLDIAKDAQNTSIDRVMRLQKLQMEREKHDKEMEDMVKKPKSIGNGGDIIETNEFGEEEVVDANYVVEEDRNTILRKRRERLLKQQQQEDVDDYNNE